MNLIDSLYVLKIISTRYTLCKIFTLKGKLDFLLIYQFIVSPMEEEELVEQLTKMGESGPIIFDRHFFNLVCFDVMKWTDHYCFYYDKIL